MSDFLGWNSSYNPFELDELTYVGKLYHYTNEAGCEGIFCPKDSKGNKIDLPKDCISLRFTRIANMNRNDNEEREDIIVYVQKAIDNLLSEPESSERHITEDFANIVRSFPAQETDKYVGLYTLVSDKKCIELNNFQVKMEYSKLDYYVACFSIEPDNNHIMESWNMPIRLTFKSAFSKPDEIPHGFLNENTTIQIPGYYRTLPPYSNIDECFAGYYFKRVTYDDVEKCTLIENFLLSIYENNDAKRDIENQLQDMYSLYDAFFKKKQNSENEYWKENEVRFVIRLPHNIQPDLLKKYGIVLDGEIEEDGETKYIYLYLPVSKRFLIGGGPHA